MNLISILQELWRRRLLVVLAAIAAAAITAAAVFQVSVSPPQIAKRSNPEARGSISILVDSAKSPIADARRDLAPLTGRAAVFARYIAGGDVVARIAKANGIPVRQIEVSGPLPLPGQAPGVEQGPGQPRPYEITASQQGELPIVMVETRAPTTAEARGLAAAAPAAVREIVRQIQRTQKTPLQRRVQFRVLGPAEVGVVDDAPGLKVAAPLFCALLGLLLLAILALPRLAASWRRQEAEPAPAPLPAPPEENGEAPRNGGVQANGDGHAPRKERERTAQGER